MSVDSPFTLVTGEASTWSTTMREPYTRHCCPVGPDHDVSYDNVATTPMRRRTARSRLIERSSRRRSNNRRR
jgi:hypothetical protein